MLQDSQIAETLEGEGILAETPTHTGLLLWCFYRDVLLWSTALPETRGSLFASSAVEKRAQLIEAAKPDARLRHALGLLMSIFRDEPSTVDRVRTGAMLASEWAAARGKPSAAIAFARAAAAAKPTDPAPALESGRLLARHGDLHLATNWLRRAVGLARRSHAWAVYGEAMVELARLSARQRNTAAARKSFLTALRAARRFGLRSTTAHASHGLFRLAVSEGDYPAAELHAGRAIRAFGRQHPDLPQLLHEMAELLTRKGEWESALPRLQELLPGRKTGAERLETLLLIIQAAAHNGDTAALHEAWFDASSVIHASGQDVDTVRALLALARATVEAGEDSHADEAARRALALATRLKERALALEATAILDRVRPARHTS